MSTVQRVALAALVALPLLIGATAPAAKPAFSVTSSIDGKTILPHRIRWIAHPKLPSVQIKEVDFLIDGRLAWVEHKSPYVYSEDDKSHLGYLVTSWLAPGRHRFTVKATASDGRKANDVVTARVTSRPALPAGLAGTWQRAIGDVSHAPAAGTPDNPTDTFTPAGTYTMVIDERQIQMRFPGSFHRPQSDDTGEGWILDSDYTVASSTLRAAGPVTFEPFHEQAEYGWWCYPDGPSGDYTWSIGNNTLDLTPRGGGDPCGIRGFVWAGQWTRVG